MAWRPRDAFLLRPPGTAGYLQISDGCAGRSSLSLDPLTGDLFTLPKAYADPLTDWTAHARRHYELDGRRLTKVSERVSLRPHHHCCANTTRHHPSRSTTYLSVTTHCTSR